MKWGIVLSSVEYLRPKFRQIVKILPECLAAELESFDKETINHANFEGIHHF